jgi:FkbM family methyltransferase
MVAPSKIVMPRTAHLLALEVLAAYVRHAPIDIGKWRLALRSIELVRKYGTKLGARTIRTKHGFRMKLNLADWVDQHIYATGEFEPDVIAVARRFLQTGMTALDIGANVGFLTMVFSSIVGGRGRVIALEPQPVAINRLKVNLELNPDVYVELHQIAASDEEGEINFNCGPFEHSGIGSIRQLNRESKQISVRTVKVDSILDPQLRINLVKIDVEGAELKVISGMQETIARWKPDLIIEVSDSYLTQMGGSAAELCNTLCSFGYSMFQIGWDGLTKIDGWHSGLPDQFNAVFTTTPSVIADMIVRAA